jgi:parallel beta-helix repeat protein
MSNARNLGNRATEIVSVRDFGAVGDGTTDDTAAIQAAIDATAAFSVLSFPSGTYVISSAITGKDNLTIDFGNAKLLAKASTNFEYMITATDKTNFILMNGTLDINKTNRSSGQNIRFMGAGFLTSSTGCTNCHFKNMTVTGALGYSSIPGVGLTISGGTRCTVSGCYIYDCGGTSGTDAADAVYTSGTQNTIANCTAYNCTDTGFVLENTDFGIITGCTSISCSCGAAITNATSTDKYGNVINGLTVKNWNASNTGGIQIGTPTATTGSLYDTVVSGVTMYADTSGSNGAGAAINIRKIGSGQTNRCTITGVRIDGTKNQGILVDGNAITIASTTVNGTVDGCIQFQSGSDHFVSGCFLNGGSFGVIATSSASVTVSGSVCKSNTTGIAALNTSTVDSIMTLIKSPASARYSKDAGATLNVLSTESNQLMINNASGSATSGSIVNKFVVVDRTGSPLGYVPVYNT